MCGGFVKHDDAIMARLYVMSGHVRDRLGSPLWRSIADGIKQSGRGDAGRLDGVYSWVLSRLRYAPDPRGVDMYLTPEAALRRGAGDCDEHATMIALLLKQMGYRVKLRAASKNGERFTHVYAMALVGPRWVAVDTVARRGIDFELPHKRTLDLEV